MPNKQGGSEREEGREGAWKIEGRKKEATVGRDRDTVVLLRGEYG